MPKNILLFGVTGQTGSWMVDYLLKNTDLMIYGVVRHISVKNYKHIEHNLNNPRFKLVNGDLNDEVSIKKCFDESQPDYCINFAAMSFVFESWNSPMNTWRTNTEGVLHILETIRRYYPKCRFGNAGSSEEWGDVTYSPQDEKHPARPRSVYGASKSATRNLIKVYRESYNLHCLQWWGTNHESERRGSEFVSKKCTEGVARIKHALDNDKTFEPIKFGKINGVYRDWSHAYDFCEAIWRMMNQEKYLEETFRKDWEQKYPNDNCKVGICFQNFSPKEYIMSSNETHELKEFIQVAFSAAGITNTEWDNEELFYINDKGNKLKLVTTDDQYKRLAEVPTLHGCSDALRRDLGWKPNISFEQLVGLMVGYDIKNYKE